MTITERLKELDAIKARNAERDQEYAAAQKRIAGAHRAVEISASAILDSLDILAQHHGVPRAELLELLVDTMQALEQHREQEKCG